MTWNATAKSSFQKTHFVDLENFFAKEKKLFRLSVENSILNRTSNKHVLFYVQIFYMKIFSLFWIGVFASISPNGRIGEARPVSTVIAFFLFPWGVSDAELG